MKTKDNYKVVEGDVVEFKRSIPRFHNKEEQIVVRAVVLDRHELIVVVSLFPYSETKLVETDFKVVERVDYKKEKYEVGDLVRLRGSDSILYIEQRLEQWSRQEWTYNVKEVNPSTGRKSRFVQSCLLERVE